MTAPYFATYTGTEQWIVLMRDDDGRLHFKGFTPDHESGKAQAAAFNLEHVVQDLETSLSSIHFGIGPTSEQIAACRANIAELESILWNLDYEHRHAERLADAAKRTEALAVLSITDTDLIELALHRETQNELAAQNAALEAADAKAFLNPAAAD